MKNTTRAWVRKAESDLRGAERLATARKPFHDLVCFHCQQSAEKYLKALLEEAGQPTPKIHDLEDLLNRTVQHYPPLGSYRRGLRLLAAFSVNPRYPAMWATKRQAAAARRWAAKGAMPAGRSSAFRYGRAGGNRVSGSWSGSVGGHR